MTVGLALLLLLGLMAVFVGVVALIMALVNRMGAPKVALIIGIAAAAYQLFTVFQTLIGCAAEPQFIPPVDADGGEGMLVHACDGPGGMLSYGYSLVAGPLAFALLMWLSFRQARRLRRFLASTGGESL